MANRFVRYCSFILNSLIFFVVIGNLHAKDLPQQFNPPRLVNDYVGILSQQEFMSLESKLVAYNDSTSTQIAILIERSTEGEDIFSYTQRLAESWGIGQSGKDNGVLLYMATEDRKLRIHTGYGAEFFLTDALAKRIIDNVIIPNFKNGNYFQGFDRAIDIIKQLGNGEYESENKDERPLPLVLIVIIIIIIIVIISIISHGDGGDDGGYWHGGRYDHYGPRRKRGGWIITPGTGSGSFGGGGFGGGGFGGFGGGSFGGGGASGSW